MKGITNRIEEALNEQISLEGESSQYYLSMASWAENQGYSGTAEFLYLQADEEREHMLKLIKYVNERGGVAVIPKIGKPRSEFNSLTEIFNLLLAHEIGISSAVNNIVHICLEEKDYTTHNFMQWYVNEQIEEEATANAILDRIKLIDGDKSGFYLFDKDINNLRQAESKPIA